MQATRSELQRVVTRFPEAPDRLQIRETSFLHTGSSTLGDLPRGRLRSRASGGGMRLNQVGAPPVLGQTSRREGSRRPVGTSASQGRRQRRAPGARISYAPALTWGQVRVGA